MNVMSLRLSSEELSWIAKWAKQERKEKSEAARKLLKFGWMFACLERYREGKISLGRLAREWRVPVVEVMDFLSKHGVSSNLTDEDYLQSVESLRKIL
jgi:hypothetical protein